MNELKPQTWRFIGYGFAGCTIFLMNASFLFPQYFDDKWFFLGLLLLIIMYVFRQKMFSYQKESTNNQFFDKLRTITKFLIYISSVILILFILALILVMLLVN